MILLNDDEIGHLVKEGLMTVHSYIAIGQMVARAQLKKVAGQMEDTYDKAPIGKKFAAMDRFMLDLLREVE